MFASSSIKSIWVARYIMEGMKAPGKSKEVMMWLRLGCDLAIYIYAILVSWLISGFAIAFLTVKNLIFERLATPSGIMRA